MSYWRLWTNTAAWGAAVLTAGMLSFWGTRVAHAAKPGADHFPNVPLITQDGKSVRFYDDLIKGKIVAINFIYSHCEFSCPLETARLAQVQDLLGARVGKDIFFYSISIDPNHDTPAVLKEYARKFHAGAGWTFLTGKKRDIDLLADKLGLSDGASITDAPGMDIDGHTPHLLIGNEATGQWLRDAGTDNPRFLARLIADFVGNSGGTTLPGHGGTGQAFDINSPGRYLFAKECAACHTMGHGDKIGPDLAGVTGRRDPEWLARYIVEPDKVLASGDPIAKQLLARYGVMMPNLRVGDRDLAVLLDFLRAPADQGNSRAGSSDASSAAKATGSSPAVSYSGKGDFGLSVDPGAVTVIAGAETRFTVSFKSVDGFAGWVQPQTLGMDSARGAVGSWSLPAVKVAAGGVAKATFTVLTLLDTPPGEYPIVFQGTNGSVTHQASAVTLRVAGPPKNAITAAFHPAAPVVGVTNCTISGNATAGGWVTDISTFPDGSVHSFSSKSNGDGSYTDRPFVLNQLGTYHDVLIDTETGGRTEIAYHGVGDFAATIAGPRRTIVSGQTAQFAVTFSSVSGFSGVVKPTINNTSDLAGATVTWSLPSVGVRPGTPGSSQLTIKTASAMPATTLTIHVQGLNGSVARAAPDIVLRVMPPQTFGGNRTLPAKIEQAAQTQHADRGL
jgi:protein SCO1